MRISASFAGTAGVKLEPLGGLELVEVLLLLAREPALAGLRRKLNARDHGVAFFEVIAQHSHKIAVTHSHANPHDLRLPILAECVDGLETARPPTLSLTSLAETPKTALCEPSATALFIAFIPASLVGVWSGVRGPEPHRSVGQLHHVRLTVRQNPDIRCHAREQFQFGIVEPDHHVIGDNV